MLISTIQVHTDLTRNRDLMTRKRLKKKKKTTKFEIKTSDASRDLAH